MPDFTHESFYHCLSAENFVTEVEGSKKYTVRYDSHSHKNRDVEHDYSCTCDAYKFGKGYCKHIEQVIKSGKHCNWLQFTEGGQPLANTCPKCGGPISAMRWAV